MYSIDELVRESGYSVSTIRKLVAAGYLPKPVGGRRHARYPPPALARLRELRTRVTDRERTEDLVERYGGDPARFRRVNGRAE